MGRGGKVGSKQDFKKRARSKDKVSDDSDEDYVISDEEYEISEDELEDYCSSVDGFVSEEDSDSFVEGEEEVDVRKVVRSKARKSKLGNGKNGVKMARKRKRETYGEDEDEDEDYEEEEEDEDEEFTPDELEDDCLDEEEELVVTKKNSSYKRKNNNVSRRGTRKKGSVRGRKRRESKVSKKPSGRKRRSLLLRRKQSSDGDEDDDIEFTDDMVVVKEKSKKNLSRKRRRYVVPSDSDFVSSGPSDYEYTISEEEREQVREANQLCGSLKASLRNSSSSKIIQEDDGNLCQPRKTLGKKGKEKIEEVKSEVAKQVCGICLSEEDKRRLRGTLNCCSHYFCFTCIMEWSKVESRCPLCKQRFKTITKPERSTVGVDLRSVVIQVPERDQVYQPSEEDLRSFLDPYENVICSECHHGGDDGLMLLCDICDSSAHTYCVGLGRVVPEGNWYCDGCRPVALGSCSSQVQDPLLNRTTTTNLYNRPSPIVSFGEGFDPYSVSSPCVPLPPGSGNLPSPRYTVGDVQAASPGFGAGAPTLSGRRWIHRHIQNLLSMNRMNSMAGSTDGMPTTNLSSGILNSQVDQGRETVVQPARAQETEPLHQAIVEERLHEHPATVVENGHLFAPGLNHFRRQAVQDPTITAANGSVHLTLWPELAGIDSLPSFEQLHCSGTSNIGTDGCMSPFTAKDELDFYVEREQLQSVVKSHLKILSRGIELDPNTFKDIARSSTHTILAACGREHIRGEVHIVSPPSICSHIERISSGQTSLMKSHCSSCFDSFVKDVVKRIIDTRLPQWLSLGL